MSAAYYCRMLHYISGSISFVCLSLYCVEWDIKP